MMCLWMDLFAKCQGKFINPFTDVSWSGIFPITIGGFNVTPQHKDYEEYRKTIICYCKPLKMGIKASFFEPVRLIDVTRTPFCLVGLGGIGLGKNTVRKHGTIHNRPDTGRSSFYQVHWYIYPLIFWLELLMDFVCVSRGKLDVGFITEFDPGWQDDEWGFLVNPEAGLFSSKLLQLACTADCFSSTFRTPINTLFWCAGCLGSLYPFGGSVEHHVGGIQASSLLVQRIIAKFHRLNLVKGYETDNFCGGHYAPNIQKTLYKTQLVYPVSAKCEPLGKSEALWGSGKSFPYKGEDFVYLLFKKRKCCLGPGITDEDLQGEVDY